MKQVIKKDFYKNHQIKFIGKLAFQDRVIKKKFRCKVCKIFTVLNEHSNITSEVICLK